MAAERLPHPRHRPVHAVRPGQLLGAGEQPAQQQRAGRGPPLLGRDDEVRAADAADRSPSKRSRRTAAPMNPTTAPSSPDRDERGQLRIRPRMVEHGRLAGNACRPPTRPGGPEEGEDGGEVRRAVTARISVKAAKVSPRGHRRRARSSSVSAHGDRGSVARPQAPAEGTFDARSLRRAPRGRNGRSGRGASAGAGRWSRSPVASTPASCAGLCARGARARARALPAAARARRRRRLLRPRPRARDDARRAHRGAVDHRRARGRSAATRAATRRSGACSRTTSRAGATSSSARRPRAAMIVFSLVVERPDGEQERRRMPPGRLPRAARRDEHEAAGPQAASSTPGPTGSATR